MPVRNLRKKAAVAGIPWSGPKRKQFLGDPASLPFEHNPEPITGSRKLKPTYEKPKRKAPGELLVGLGKGVPHLHTSKRQCNFKGHSTDSNRARFVPLTKARKKG